jgi:hypothetical protein
MPGVMIYKRERSAIERCVLRTTGIDKPSRPAKQRSDEEPPPVAAYWCGRDRPEQKCS